MADDNTTSFDLIEGHKENIQPLSSGRSARALAATLSPLSSNPQAVRSEHYARQVEFEDELKTASDLDDPLEVWVRYVNWTIETFPSGQSTESGLLPLLERATRAFLQEPQYKNDPRYLKLWVHYIQFFSDAPREAYAYLARHDIGQRLALFYEEYAALLESMGRKSQAAEIYQSGIENNARPVDRLQRKFEEFQHRLEANPPAADEPHSPALPVVRPALAAKPFGGAASGGLSTESSPQQQQPQSGASKSKKPKMAIFSDADNTSSSKPAEKESRGWESIGTLEHRKKENAQEPKPWAGETLKTQGKKASGGEKLMVFRDTSQSSKRNAVSTNPSSAPGKRPERVAIPLELVYPEDDEDEYSFEELQTIRRGCSGIDWDMARSDAAYESREEESPVRRTPLEGSRTPIKVKTVLSPSPNKQKPRRKKQGPGTSPTMTFHTRAATDEIYSIFNQPLEEKDGSGSEDEESEGNSDESDGEDYTTTTQVENTETFQPEEDDTDARSVKSDWSDFTMGKGLGEEEAEAADRNEEDVRVAANGMQKLAIFADKENEQARTHVSPQPSRKLKIPSPPEDFDPPTLPYHMAKDQSQVQNRHPYMTPIVERTESLPPTTVRGGRAFQHAKTPSRSKMPAISDERTLNSSPLDDIVNDFHIAPPSPPPRPDLIAQRTELETKKPLTEKTKQLLAEKVQEPKAPKGPIIQELLCNPLDESLRATIFEKLQPPLKSFEGYYEHKSSKFGKGSEIRKFTKAMKQNGEKTTTNFPNQPVLEFVTGDGGSIYAVKKELGKGAFAPVYLTENVAVADAEDEAEEGDTDENDPDILAVTTKLAGRKRFEALKMEDPPSPWEFYIIRQASRRLGVARAAESIIKAHEMHLFSDEGYLVLEYRDQGTILDLVNIAKSEAANGAGAAGGVMDEVLVMFMAIELLRTVEGLHSKDLIHGDLKADNCLVRFETVSDYEWSARYRRDGSDGWSRKGVSLIDLGRGIDMRLFDPAVQFVADWKTDHQDCAEMREMRPWTYQVDYHGLAATVHSMLFGKYIETTKGGLGASKHYKITSSLKRYWQQDIWNEFFEILLNPQQHVEGEVGGKMPINKSLRHCRERMEDWLESNCDKGVGLKSMIRRMESLLGGKRK